QFRREDWGIMLDGNKAPIALDPTTAIQLQFDVPLADQFDIWIDNVGLICGSMPCGEPAAGGAGAVTTDDTAAVTDDTAVATDDTAVATDDMAAASTAIYVSRHPTSFALAGDEPKPSRQTLGFG